MFNIADTRNGSVSYATFWEAEDKGKFAKGRISTSQKQKDGTYKNSNWFATFVGNAHDKALQLEAKDRITITDGFVENPSVKDEQGAWHNYLNVVIFDFNKSEPNNQSSHTGLDQAPEVDDSSEDEDDDLPF